MAEGNKIMSVEGDELVATQTELMQKNVGRELVEKAVQGDEAAFEELYMKDRKNNKGFKRLDNLAYYRTCGCRRCHCLHSY